MLQFGNGGGISVTLEGPFGAVSSAVRLVEIQLPASQWKGGASPYFQTTNIQGISIYSKVDLLPGPAQLEEFRAKELAFTTENDGGVVTVYAIGSRPESDITMQAVITEVTI